MEGQLHQRPNIDKADVQSYVEKKFNCKVKCVEELRAFEDRNFFIQIEDNKGENRGLLSSIKSDKIITKAVKYSEKSVVKWKSLKSIMVYLQQNGFNCTQILYIDEKIPTVEKNGSPLMDHWKEVNIDQVIKHTGEMVANLHNCLQNLNGSQLGTEDTDNPWNLDNAITMMEYLDVVKDMDKRRIIKSIIETFCNKMEQIKHHLPKGVIHGDLSDLNLIVNCQDTNGELKPLYPSTGSVNDLFGIIDFADMCVSCYVFETAQIIRDFMVSTYKYDVKPNGSSTVAASFLAGYLKHRTLNQYEIHILFMSIMAALCQYHVIGEYEFIKQSDNEYTKMGSSEALQLLVDYHDCSGQFMSNLIKNLQNHGIEIKYSEL